MSNDNREILESIFNIVNDWLKFAESKNAVLITLTGASLAALLNHVSGNKMPDTFLLKIYLYNFVIFSVIGISISLISFIPQTKMFWLWREKNTIKNPNYYFFGDLAHLSPDEIINFLYANSGTSISPIHILRKNLASQIINNSKICRRKFHFFRVALWFILTSIFTPVISIILYIVFDPN